MKSSKTFSEILDWGIGELAFLGDPEAKISAEELLSEAAGLTRTEIHLCSDQRVDEETQKHFIDFIRRRKQRIPTAYLTGKAGFWEEILKVSRQVLIPRPETEIVIESFLTQSGTPRNGSFSFLDMGAGSGAIGIAVLRLFVNARGTFSDISSGALEVSRRNLEQYGLTDRAELIESDLFENMGSRNWDVIFSNPPYLSSADWENIEPELLEEPRLALDGGEDGLDFYRQIIRQAPRFLTEGGTLCLEIGIRQAGSVRLFLQENGFEDIKIFPDYLGIERVVMARRKQHG